MPFDEMTKRLAERSSVDMTFEETVQYVIKKNFPCCKGDGKCPFCGMIHEC